MVSRGYDGEARSLPFPTIQSVHWAILISGLSILTLLILIAYLFWG